MNEQRGQIIIITGLSGSGKTTALNALEDQGFISIGNLPVLLLSGFLSLHDHTVDQYLKLAVVMDIRGKSFLEHFPQVFSEIKALGYDLKMVFLEASDEAIIRNYSYTRRPHPMEEGGNLPEAIGKERASMKPVREAAHITIDTTGLSSHQLRSVINNKFPGNDAGMSIELLSFGYRYGLPQEADIVLDVRFLPNPHYDDELRPLTGCDKKVFDFVFSNGRAQEFLDKTSSLVNSLLPLYDQEGRSYLTIAVGCTGGRHRSVSVIEELSRRLAGVSYELSVRHREINK